MSDPIVVGGEPDDPRRVLHDILERHSVVDFRRFIQDHRADFVGLTDEQLADDDYLFACLHLYKAQLSYFGERCAESFQYCVDHGIIHVPGKAERMAWIGTKQH